MKIVKWILGIVASLYFIILLAFYFNQEKFGFHPKKTPKEYVFESANDFQEMYFTTQDGIELHSVLVKSDSSKGLIIYLHGSGGNVARYMPDAPVYAGFGYDFLLFEYRGYGKSGGEMQDENQFTKDLDLVYNEMKKKYKEENIVLIGFSMGTFAASYLAAHNNPKLLVLESPPYWIIEQFIKKYFFFPIEYISKYQFKTFEYVKKTQVPILLFLGEKDKLSKETRWPSVLKEEDKFFIIEGAEHQNFAGKKKFLDELNEVL